MCEVPVAKASTQYDIRKTCRIIYIIELLRISRQNRIGCSGNKCDGSIAISEKSKCLFARYGVLCIEIHRLTKCIEFTYIAVFKRISPVIAVFNNVLIVLIIHLNGVVGTADCISAGLFLLRCPESLSELGIKTQVIRVDFRVVFGVEHFKNPDIGVVITVKVICPERHVCGHRWFIVELSEEVCLPVIIVFSYIR